MRPIRGAMLVVLVGACAKAPPAHEETMAIAPAVPSTSAVAADAGAPDTAPPSTGPGTDLRSPPPAAPEDAGEPTIPCASIDDCWIEARRPIARPKELRGRKFKPCRDGEVAPKCKDGLCAAVPYKC